MKKQKRGLLCIIMSLLIFLSILFNNSKIFAVNIADLIQEVEYTDEYKKWLELSDEEREKELIPRMYEMQYRQS